MQEASAGRHAINLIVKMVFITAVLSLLLPSAGTYTFGGVLWVAGGLTLLSYLVGDLGILPAYGNWTAVAGDGVLTLLGLWALPPILGTPGIPFTAMIMAALLIGAGEYYLHRYLQGELTVGVPADAEEPAAAEGDTDAAPEDNGGAAGDRGERGG